MKMLIKLLIAACMAPLAHGLAFAQTFPSKPLKIVVPFAAGGSADAMARILAQGMTAQLGQPIVKANNIKLD